MLDYELPGQVRLPAIGGETKKCELETAAIPQLMLRAAPIMSMIAATRTQPAPLYDRSSLSYDID